MKAPKPTWKAKPGYHFEHRDGCDCGPDQCPWHGACLGQTWKHWREVPDAGNVVTLPVVRIER